MTVKKLTERQIKWFSILFKYDFVINYITGKNNERTDVLSKQEQNVSEVGNDKLEYKMAQLLKPRILNYEPRTNERPELYQSKTLNFIEIQLVVTGKTGLIFSQFLLKRPKTNWKICGPLPKTKTTFTNRW